MGGDRPCLSCSARPADRTGARAPRGKAAAPDQRVTRCQPLSVLDGPSSITSLRIIDRRTECVRIATGATLQGATGRRAIVVTAAALALFLACSAAPAGAALTEGARLAAIYDTILDARFDEAAEQLRHACPPAPQQACQALAVVSLWWRILIEPESRALDGRLTGLAAQ